MAWIASQKAVAVYDEAVYSTFYVFSVALTCTVSSGRRREVSDSTYSTSETASSREHNFFCGAG